MEDKFAGLNTQLDIVDEQGNKTGEVKSYDEVHAQGLLHKSAHVWVLNSKGEILLQKRSKYVRAYPSHWDTSASGHVNSGQTSLETAKVETEEELGLVLPPEAFELIFSYRQNVISNNGSYIENEIDDVYLAHYDLEIHEFKIQPDEIEEVRWLSKKEFEKWINGAGEPMSPHEEEYKKILEYLK